MASRATTTILLLLATTAAISTANVDAAKRSARRPMASPSSVRGGGGGSKSRSLKSSSTLPAKRAASLHSMPSRPVGAAVKRSSSKLSKSSTSSSTPAATISAAADATRKKRAASLCSPSRSSVGAGVNKRSPLPAPETCVSSLLDLSPCLAFFKDASATAAPAGCCAGLRTIIDTQPVCLCHIVNHTLERAIGVDIPVDRALTLLGDICRLAPPQEILTCADKGAVPPLYTCPAPSV